MRLYTIMQLKNANACEFVTFCRVAQNNLSIIYRMQNINRIFIQAKCDNQDIDIILVAKQIFNKRFVKHTQNRDIFF